jgi:transcriptional regulatory protein GAL4
MLLSISGLFSKINNTASSVQEQRSTPPYNPIRRISMPSASLNAALTAGANVNRLIGAYFILYNSSYPVLHESSFRKQRERRATAKATACWTALYHMVLTIGLWMLGEEPEESPYFAVARSWLSARALESGTLGCVQAFLLMVSPALFFRDRLPLPNPGRATHDILLGQLYPEEGKTKHGLQHDRNRI